MACPAARSVNQTSCRNIKQDPAEWAILGNAPSRLGGLGEADMSGRQQERERTGNEVVEQGAVGVR
ncbi:hypothetical protein AB0L97_05280 [Nocardia sp. NPDC051911]|uniref:hypothetical protein n=1 Tax=Nocardia sp. NPDC051911 TaxID=3154648 RepID=UPI00343BF52E